MALHQPITLEAPQIPRLYPANAEIVVQDPLITPQSFVADYLPDIRAPEFSDLTTIHTDGVVMTDGSHYGIIRAIPERPITDLTLGFTSAWFTSVRGHNRRTVEHFARRGLGVVLIGGEGSFRGPDDQDNPSNLPDLVSQFSGVSLLKSIHNYHQILDVVGVEDELKTQTEDMLLIGESRAAVVGMGMLATASQHDRNFVYADLTAPPFPKGLTPGNSANMLRQLSKEPLALARAAGSLTLRRIIHYPETLDLHPMAIAHNLSMFSSIILTGEAGGLGQRVPSEQHMHLTTYSDDWASMRSVWEDIFEGHKNVDMKQVGGLHATIAHPLTIGHIENRIHATIEAVNAAGSTDPRDIDFSEVRSLS